MPTTIEVDAVAHERLAAHVLPKPMLLIGGDWQPSSSGAVFTHVDPATGRGQREVPVANAGDVARAVDAAHRAFPRWRRWPPGARRDTLFRFAELLRANADQLAQVQLLETGLPVSFTSWTAGRGSEFLAYYAGWCDKVEGALVPANPALGVDYVVPEPFGVVALLMTWNGGVSALGRKVGAALAAGNTAVIKASELAPFSVIRFAELGLEAGLPPGVLNVVTGGAAAGECLVRHPAVRKVSFTGGAGTARKIQVAAADAPKPVAFELGGKSANIIFADAPNGPLEAAHAAATNGLSMSGQGCALPTRVLAERCVYDEVVEALAATATAVVIGDPLDPVTHLGPIVSAAHCERVLAMVERSRATSGGTVVVGGDRLGGGLAEGYFVASTVLAGVSPGCEIAEEEVFGPVLVALPFDDEDDAVRIANESAYGLSAYVNTSDLGRAHRIAAELDVGSVTVNGFASGGVAAPFGGVKGSGFGREGGRAGFDEFVTLKNVFVATAREGTERR